MRSKNEEMQVEFHNKASEKFFCVCEDFAHATSSFSRGTGEASFQQAKKQYATKMDQELQAIAKEVLTKHKQEKQTGEIDQLLYRFIQNYLHRFMQKVAAM